MDARAGLASLEAYQSSLLAGLGPRLEKDLLPGPAAASACCCRDRSSGPTPNTLRAAGLTFRLRLLRPCSTMSEAGCGRGAWGLGSAPEGPRAGLGSRDPANTMRLAGLQPLLPAPGAELTARSNSCWGEAWGACVGGEARCVGGREGPAAIGSGGSEGTEELIGWWAAVAFW
jgi:hypothetical protein